jgi:hypothetical protein
MPWGLEDEATSRRAMIGCGRGQCRGGICRFGRCTFALGHGPGADGRGDPRPLLILGPRPRASRFGFSAWWAPFIGLYMPQAERLQGSRATIYNYLSHPSEKGGMEVYIEKTYLYKYTLWSI